VETTHQLIEAALYDREVFSGRLDFLDKAWSWQAYFNLNRKNPYQGWRTPAERLGQAAPNLSGRVCLLPPVDPGSLLPRSPDRRQESRTQEMIKHLTEPGPDPPSGSTSTRTVRCKVESKIVCNGWMQNKSRTHTRYNKGVVEVWR